MRGTLTFLKSFISDKDVASITPSSRYCVKKLCNKIDFSNARIFIEYGGGTGVFTKYMLSQMTPDSQLFVFETNEKFYQLLSEIEDPRLQLFNHSVEDILDLLPAGVVGSADHIISGIPFSFFNWELKIDILNKTLQTLKAKGSFLAYQTSGHLKKPLLHSFGNYTTDFCWKNIPPYFIYEAVKR